MAEFDRKKLATDDALAVPHEFAEGFDRAAMSADNFAKVLDKLITKSIAQEKVLSTGTSAQKLAKDTNQITIAQQELVKIQKQIITVQAKTNDEYIRESKTLDSVKKALKEKSSLGERDSKTVNAQNSSTQQLAAALIKNRAAYETLTGAEERNSAAGLELLGIIKSQDKELKGLKDSVGQNFLEVGKYENALKNMKAELKAAQSEMIGIAATLGQDSEEFREAAAKAGELKDQMQDVQEAANAVSGEPIERFGQSFGLLGSKLKAGDLKGATGAIKGITSASKDLTFKQAISGVGGFGKAMGALGKALLTNPLILIAAVVIGIGVAVFALKDRVKPLAIAFDFVGAALDYVVQVGKDFLDFLGLSTFALDDATKKTVDAANKQREKLAQRYDEEIKLAEAAGKSTVEAEIAKQKAILHTSFLAAKALQNQKKNGLSVFTEEQQKELDEQIKINREASIELQAIKLKQGVELQKISDDAAKKAKEARLREQGDAFKLSQFLIQNQIEQEKEIVDNNQKSLDARIFATEKIQDLKMDLAEMEMENALKQADLTASGEKLIYAKFQQDINDITKEGVQARNKITAESFVDDEALRKKRIEAEKDSILKIAEQQQAALEQQIQAIKEEAIARGESSDEVDKLIIKKQKELADDQVQVQIDALRKILMIKGLTADEQSAIDKELAKLQIDLTNAVYDNLNNKTNTQLEKGKEFLDKYKHAFGDFIDSLGALSQAFTQGRLQKLEEEQKANEEQKDAMLEKEDEQLKKRLEDETLTDEQRKQIEENGANRKQAIEESAEKRQLALDARRKKEVRKQAIFEKGIAIVKGTINLASAIMAALTVLPPASFILAAATAAIAGIQLATIIATPIPAAAKGIKNHKGGPIRVGEQGAELFFTPTGGGLTPGIDTVMDLPSGSSVVPHEETMKRLARAGLSASDFDRRPDSNKDVVRGLKSIEKTIKNKREYHGAVSGYTENGSRVKYIDGLRNR